MLNAPQLRLVQKDEQGHETDVTPPLTIGALEVKLASTAAEIDAVQALRYRVFYEEQGATPTTEMAARRRDYDSLDQFCDHLLVCDTSKEDLLERIVGTYRMIRKPHAEANGSWYSVGEYDVSKIIANADEVLEVGRSCIDADYRNRYVMTLMWKGIAVYAAQHQIKTIFGCASMRGTDPDAHAQALSYLYYHHLAPPASRPVALPDRYVDMRRLPEDQVDVKLAQSLVPSLIKGYMNLGGFVGDGAVIDWQWGSVDVAIVVQTDRLTGRYADHFKRQTGGLLGA